MNRARLARWLPFLAAVFVLCGCGSSSSSPVVTLQVTPNTTQNIDEGQSVKFQVFLTNDTNNQGVVWILTGSSCSGTNCGTVSPAGTNCATYNSSAVACCPPGSATCTYQAPASVGQQLTVSLEAQSVADKAATQTVSINVVLPPAFGTACPPAAGEQPQTFPNGSNGVPYSGNVQACGGVSPLGFSLGGGALPSGLKLNTTGTISGTPSGSGTSNFTVTISDQGTPPLNVSQQFSITINPPPALSIVTTALSAGYQTIPYGAKVVAQGGVPPLTWALVPGSGTGLPPGLNVTSTNGAITGTPTAQGTFTFSVRVSDQALPQPQSVSQAFSITIGAAPPALVINTASLPNAIVAHGYSAPLQASGGIAPYTWSLQTGLLPSGLSLSTDANGAGSISGVPHLIENSTFTVSVSDSEPAPQVASRTFTIAVNSGPVSSNALLQGIYAFLFTGYAAPATPGNNGQTNCQGSLVIVGTLAFNGSGGISTGNEATNCAAVVNGQVTPEPLSGISITGSYAMNTASNADGRGTLTLTTTSPLSSAQLTTSYQIALDSGGNLHFIENDASGTSGSGIMKAVVGSSFSTSSFVGNYVFEFAGLDSAGKRTVMAGMLQADGSTFLTSGGLGPNVDINEGGQFSNQLCGSQGCTVSGQFGAGGSSGAASLVIPFQANRFGADTWGFVFYFVSPGDLFFINFGRPGGQSQTVPNIPPRLAGEMVLQQPSYQFTPYSLAGAATQGAAGTSIASGMGLASSNSSAFAGLLTSTACDGTSAVSFTYDQNSGGTVTPPGAPAMEVCTIGANGKVAFTGSGGASLTSPVAAAYLAGPGAGFIIGNDAQASGGILEPQTANFSTFGSAGFQGGYSLAGSLFAPEPKVPNLSGEVAAAAIATGQGNFSGTFDAFASGAATLAQPLSGPYTVAASGRGTFTQNSSADFPTNSVFYVVAPGELRVLDTTSSHPQIIFFGY